MVQIVRYFQMRYRMNQMIALLEEKRGCHAVDRALLFAEKSCHASRSVLLRKERGCHAVDRALWDEKKHGQRSWMALWNVARGGLHSVTPFVRYGKRSTFAAASGR